MLTYGDLVLTMAVLQLLFLSPERRDIVSATFDPRLKHKIKLVSPKIESIIKANLFESKM